MIRVAHILGDLEFGGLQRQVLTLIRELPAYSHAVVFNSPTRGPMYDDYAATCRMVQCTYARGRITSALAYIPRLARELKDFAPDVVVAHLFGNHLVVAAAAKLARVPATYGVSANDPVHHAGSRWRPMLLAQVARPICRGEIAVSEYVGTVLRSQLGLPARRVHVIANGVDVDEIARRADTGRAGTVRPAGEYRLLMIALISRAKDHETAIRAVAMLRERGHPVTIDFAGDVRRRERRDALEALAAQLGVRDAVRFLGPRDDVPELIGASDVVVHSTHSEGFGLVLLEAFASRTPVVATDVPACREVLDNGSCGLLVPRRDAAALADAVIQLLHDDALRRRLVAEAWAQVRDRYHVRIMAAGYAALIESSVRQRAGRS
jgi:glycosyltransferase involved in cell wall biosynthesis